MIPTTTITRQSEPFIQLNRVVKKFKNAAGEFDILRGVDLGINQGEFVAVVGKSGSGKSTLLNMITGIDHPTTGEVIIDRMNIYKINESQRALWRGKTLGIVFQFFQLLPMLSILENVMLPMDYVDLYATDERPQKAMELLDLVGLTKQAHKLPSAISTGQQQSAAIARALATNPPIIVADEPTGNLDSRSADRIIQLFSQLVDAGKTIVMVTHDPSLTERTSRTMIISDGELVNETVGKALPLLTHPQMIQATRMLSRNEFQPGETIIQSGRPVNELYLIESGTVDVIFKPRLRQPAIIAQMHQGEFFGEMELLNGGIASAEIKASGDKPVRLLTLPEANFHELLKNSPLTEEALTKLVKQRLSERKPQRRSISSLWGGEQ